MIELTNEQRKLITAVENTIDWLEECHAALIDGKAPGLQDLDQMRLCRYELKQGLAAIGYERPDEEIEEIKGVLEDFVNETDEDKLMAFIKKQLALGAAGELRREQAQVERERDLDTLLLFGLRRNPAGLYDMLHAITGCSEFLEAWEEHRND